MIKLKSLLTEVLSPHSQATSIDAKRGLLGSVDAYGAVTGYDEVLPNVMEIDHSELGISHFESGRFRFFIQRPQNTIVWNDYPPQKEQLDAACNWIEKKGFHVDRHIDYNTYYGLLKEGEDYRMAESKSYLLEALSYSDAEEIFAKFGVKDASSLSDDELKSRYKKLVLKHHPDKHPQNTVQKTHDMQMINAAMDVLTTRNKESGAYGFYEPTRHGGTTPPRQWYYRRPPERDIFSGPDAWAQAGWSGGMPNSTHIYNNDFRDLNYCKKAAWETSGRPKPEEKNEWTIWNWDGSYFRGVFSVFAVPEKLFEISQMMVRWDWDSGKSMAVFATHATDPNNVVYLINHRGKEVFKKYEHESSNRNPGNDHQFVEYLRTNL